MIKKMYRLRLNVLYVVPIVFFAGFLPRLVYLQVIKHDAYTKRADNQHHSEFDFTATRGRILDRNNRELAGSLSLKTISLELSLLKQKGVSTTETLRQLVGFMQDNETTAGQFLRTLCAELGQEEEWLKGKIEGRTKLGSIVLKNEVEDGEVAKLRESLKHFHPYIPSNVLTYHEKGKRKYPLESVGSQVIGYTMMDETGDNKGAAGIELTYNEVLRGQSQTYRARVDAKSHAMEPADQGILESTYGASVRLTIDESIQEATQKALEKGVFEADGDAGTAMVYSVKTGEVLAMASYPGFDLSNMDAAGAESRRNRAITDCLEPGSVMKILTFLSVFDEGKAEPEDSINCEGGTWRMSIGRLITDSSKQGVIPITKIFAKSSNIGSIKAASRLKNQQFYDRLLSYGFGRKTGIDFPGERSGTLRHISKWDGFSMSSLPMGYEIEVTALQMVAAVGAVANNGLYMQPHFGKEILDHNGETLQTTQPTVLRRIASPASCRKVLDMMELVVMPGGTGTAGALDEYRVGAKTGTTKKLKQKDDPKVKSTYADASYIASFCGVLPLEDPQVCIYVYVDNPKGPLKHGGSVSGPIFKNIAEQTMKIMRVPTQQAVKPAIQMEVALDKIRNKLVGRVPTELLDRTRAASVSAAGSMPALRGMSKREVVSELAKLNIKAELIGSGVVLQQSPKEYETIEPGTRARIRFGSDRDLARQQILASNAFNEPEDAETAPESMPYEPPNTSFTLALKSGDEMIPLERNFEGGERPFSGRVRRAAPTPKVSDAFPDLDEYAQESPNKKVGDRNWEEWKELEAEEAAVKLRASNEADSTEAEVAEREPDAEAQAAAETLNERPVFDGSEQDPSEDLGEDEPSLKRLSDPEFSMYSVPKTKRR